MKFMQCQSAGCSKPFQVNQFSTRIFTSYEFGVIRCPHCGNAVKSSPESLFLTHALSAVQEAQFLKDALLPA